LGFFILLIEVPWFVVPDSGGVSSNHAMEEKKEKNSTRYTRNQMYPKRMHVRLEQYTFVTSDIFSLSHLKL
jgi:hypothetical protein